MAAPPPDTWGHPVGQPVSIRPIQLSRQPVTTAALLGPTGISSVATVLVAHLIPRVKPNSTATDYRKVMNFTRILADVSVPFGDMNPDHGGITSK